MNDGPTNGVISVLPWWEASLESNDYDILVHALIDGQECASSVVTVRVRDPDLDIKGIPRTPPVPGVPDECEWDLGGFLPWNIDDDNANSRPDLDDFKDLSTNGQSFTPPTQENDLVKIKIELPPDFDSNADRVKLTYIMGNKRIRVYRDDQGILTRLGQATNFWDPGSGFTSPATLWVEGVQPSQALYDINMTLTHEHPAIWGDSCQDWLRWTVVGVDLDVDSNNDGVIDPKNSSKTGTDDHIEADPSLPGKILAVNDDHDEPCCVDNCCPKDYECCMDGTCCNTPQCLKCGPNGCEPMPDCSTCGLQGADPMPRCIGGQCLTPGCTVGPAEVSLCPGASAQFEVGFTCTNPCPPNEGVSIQVDGVLPAGISLTVDAANCGKATATGDVTVAPDASIGALGVPLRMTGVGTTECVGVVSVQVSDPAVALSRDPTEISATTTWAGQNSAWTISEITVQWDPPQCEGTLIIKGLEGEYQPPNQGTLTRVNSKLWRYTAFVEPQGELHPQTVRVHIAAVLEETEVGEVIVRVKPVHDWLVTPHKHGAGQPFHAPDISDYQAAYNYISWKYATVLATTEGSFGNVSFSTETCTSCGPSQCVAACTTVIDYVTFAAQTFSGSENRTASIIGHELKHTVGAWNQSECVAYTWEWDHGVDTGIDQDEGYLQDVQDRINEECE